MAVRAKHTGGLKRDARLRLIDNFQVQVLSGGSSLKVREGDRRASVGASGLAVLDAFRVPRTMDDAMAVLGPRLAGSQAWVEAAECISRLHRAGLLVDADDATRTVAEREEHERLAARPRRGFGGTGIHIHMLNDRRRTESLLAAVRAVVRAGDVVVDLGTGTGVLSIAAAQAGAARVYAIEESGISALAQANFRANGYGDRITLIAGRSTDVTLPERADVLTGELIGNDPLSEGVVQSVLDARKRMLKPTPRVVPRRLRVIALPITVPEAYLRRGTFHPTRLETWQSQYGMDFRALAANAPSIPSFFINPWRLSGRAIGTPVPVFDAELAKVATKDGLATLREGTFDATARAVLNGVLICFDAELGPGIRLSTHPDHVNRDSHWRHRVWVLPKPIMLEPGRRYRLTYSYRSPAHRDGVQVSP